MLRFSGVTLEAVGTGPGNETPVAAVPGLSMQIDAAAVSMSSPLTGSSQSVTYDQFADVHCGEPGALSDGSPAVAMSAAVAGRPLRWLIPASQLSESEAAVLEGVLRERVSASAPPSGGPAPAELGTGAPPPVDGPPVAPPPGFAVEPVAPPASPADGGRRRHRRRLGNLLVALIITEVLLVAAAVVVPIVASGGTAKAPPSPTAGDRQLARQLNLQKSDVPAGWSLDRSSDGPLSGFLDLGGGTGPPTRQDRKLAGQVAAQFEKCMGISPSRDRFFGSAGSKPTASASSPAFAAPASAAGSLGQEAGSSVAVFASARTVVADVAQMSNPEFPTCFGAALATSFVGAAANDGSASQLGQPVIKPANLPPHKGVATAGVDVTIPVTRQGTVVPVEFGIFLIGGGRAEATLYTFSEQDPFPDALVSSLSLVLAGNVASEGTGTVA